MRKYSLTRTLSVFSCAIATAIIGIDFNIATKPVHAALIDLTCPVGAETATYSPGITNTPQFTQATIDGAHTTCVSLGDVTIKSAKYNLTLQGPITCNNLTVLGYDITYNFNNGKSSTVHYVSSEEVQSEGETVITSIGTVTSGEFVGDMVTRTVTDTTLSPEQCLTTQGLTSITGVVTLTFTR